MDFTLGRSSKVSVAVFDVTGRKVRNVLETVTLGRGEHRLTWDGKDERGERVPSGVYFCRFVVGGRKVVRKLWVVR
jgi:flagellar hook assembly protein FlgD